MKINTLVTKYTDTLTSNFTHTNNPKCEYEYIRCNTGTDFVSSEICRGGFDSKITR